VPKITKAEMFGFETFWQKDFGKKGACKMLMKLTPGSQWTLKSTLLQTTLLSLKKLIIFSTRQCSI